MAAKTERVLIFGATGVIGKFITNAIVNAQPPFKHVGIFTSAGTVESKASEIETLKARGVEIIVGDIKDEAKVLEAYKGFDTVVSAVGRNVIAEQINLIKLAEASPSVKRFFPSEYGTDIKYGPQSAHEKPHQQKLQVRDYIESEVKRLEYTYLVTGPYADLFIGKSPDPRIGVFDMQAKKAVLLGDGEGKISLTTMNDVGTLLVAALRHPEASRNRALIVNSFTTTPKEILAEYEKQTGGQKWEVSYTPLPELERVEQEIWEKGHPHAAGATLRRIWTQGGTLYESRDNDFIEAPPSETLEQAVSAAIQKQT